MGWGAAREAGGERRVIGCARRGWAGPGGHRPAGAPQPLTALGAAGSSPAAAPRPAEVTGGAGGGAGCEGAQGGRDVKSHGKRWKNTEKDGQTCWVQRRGGSRTTCGTPGGVRASHKAWC